MAISIHTNLMAGNAARTLGSHYNRLSKSVQRLSSGLRINSAADDAAGLAIRELMRADVAGLNQGIRNANDAISMIQVADGALAIIDEKLIRMKELAEQAATGTYNSTQRLMIDSEFQAMGAEIDRIARATDFNGIHLLDGSLAGDHDGSALNSTGAMKIHFGTGNESAEDYYYVEIGDCTTAGLGLIETIYDIHMPRLNINTHNITANTPFLGEGKPEQSGIKMPPINDLYTTMGHGNFMAPGTDRIYTMFELVYMHNPQQIVDGTFWGDGGASGGGTEQNFMFIIPKGTKNIVINTEGCGYNPSVLGDNDIQLFTLNGKHLAGTPLDDACFNAGSTGLAQTSIDANSRLLGFTQADYDGTYLNTGPAVWDNCKTLNFTSYNGMTIGYSGDGERQAGKIPNDGKADHGNDFELLTIDEATEDLIFWYPGFYSGSLKFYSNLPDADPSANPDPNPGQPDPPDPPTPPEVNTEKLISIKTQDMAQTALEKVDNAIIRKDKIRAHLGALQNRLENTVTNLSIQAENLQASESRISDTDVATEMTAFVRNQILTESATAMLSQANSFPHMLMNLLG